MRGKWYMAGTEETGEHVVVLSTRLSRVGYRDLQNGYLSYQSRTQTWRPKYHEQSRAFFPSGYAPLVRHFLTGFARRLPLKELRASLREVGRTAAKEYLD